MHIGRDHRGTTNAHTRSLGGLSTKAALVGIASFALLCSTVPGPSAAAAQRARADVVTGCESPSLAGSEPSRKAPPPANWLPGARRVYCQDFPGTQLPGGWGRFSGVPGGDPAGYFDPSHVVVAGGMLQLLTAREAKIGNRWATGGVCHCGIAQTYGTYLVRSRLTGAGIDNVQMLWPVNNAWPPEVDFNETGHELTKTAWYVHYGSSNKQIAKVLKINLLRWHTWGVVWNERTMVFTVDGKVWGAVRSYNAIPHVKMTLDLSQQTWCGISPECPRRPAAMQVDWVAEYSAS